MSINKKITAIFMLISLSIMLCITMIYYTKSKNALTLEIFNHLESLISARINSLESIIDQNFERLSLVSSRTQLRISLEKYNKAPADEHLKKMIKIINDARSSIKSFQDISILNTDGKAVASTNLKMLDSPHAEKEYFIRGIKEKSADIFYLDNDNNLMLYLSGPLYRDNTLLGVVAIELKTDNIVSLVKDYSGLGKTGEMVITKTDDKGNALFITPTRFDNYSALKKIISRDNEKSPAILAIRKDSGLHKNAIDYRGNKVVAATGHIEKTGWGIYVKIDRQEAFASVNKFRYLSVIVILVSLIFIIVVSLYLARSITRPIIDFSKMAKRISEGNFSEKVKVKSKDELGVLAGSFNKMQEILNNNIIEKEKTLNKFNSLYRRHKALLDAVPDIIMEVNNNKIYTWSNKAGYEFFGDDVIGREASYYFEGEQETYGKVQPIFNGDENVIYVESWQRRKDSQKRLLAWWCRVEKDANGNAIGALSSARDITEQRETEVKLVHINNVLRAVRNVNQLITREKDKDRLLKETCDSLIETRGYKVAWISLFDKQQKLVDFIKAGSNGSYSAVERQMKNGTLIDCCERALNENEIIITRNTAKTCKKCPVAGKYPETTEFAYRLEYGGNVFGILAVTLPKDFSEEKDELSIFKEVAGDISFALGNIETEKKGEKAEESFQESERKLATLMGNLPGMVYRCRNDRNWTMEFISQGCITVTGYEFSALLGNQHISYNDLIHPDDREPVWNKIQEALLKKQSFHLEYRIKTADGSEKWVWEQGMGVFSKDGKVRALEGYITDISEKKLAEIKLHKTEEQLMQAQKMEAIGTLAGGVAHDFNNLLTVIRGNVDLLMMDIDKKDEPYDGLQQVQDATDRAVNLTRQLLLFSRKQPSEQKLMNINDTINGLQKMLKRLIGEDIKVNVGLSPDLWNVKFDPGNLEQIIMNLSVNARDAMPQGGILTIKTENVEVDEDQQKALPGSKAGKFIKLTVQDNGQGMDSNTMQRVFEPFFTTKEKGKGTGLGLSVVYGIIKENQGWINVYSEPGRGTVFNVYLPAVSSDIVTDTKTSVPLDELKGQGEIILIVEDEKGVREMAEKALSKNGYRVFTAQGIEEALQIFDREKGTIDLVFSDVVLRGKSGLHLAGVLKDKKAGIKILLSSGYTDDKSQWSVIKKERYKFLQKPYTIHNLLKTIREVLSKQQ